MSIRIPSRAEMDAQVRRYREHPFTSAQEARIREIMREEAEDAAAWAAHPADVYAREAFRIARRAERARRSEEARRGF